MTESLEARTKDAIEELEDWITSNPGEDPSDYAIHEIADSSCPIYNSDILQLAVDNIGLATDTPSLGPAFGGEPTPINIIAANIYEHIYNALTERVYEIEKEAKDEDHDILACYLLSEEMHTNCSCNCHEKHTHEIGFALPPDGCPVCAADFDPSEVSE